MITELEDPEANADVDAGLVVRTLENLLDNALKYAPRGTVIRVIAHASPDGGLSARVADHGRRIPPEHRERIFEREARLDRDLEVHARSSRGLGLAFCRFAVAAHGGRIWVEDNQPQGNVFCVEIPGPVAEAAPPAP
jgi:signal transduction histidine kinase